MSRIERIVTPAIGPTPPRGREAADVEDDPAEREIEALVTAGDESRDAPAPSASEQTPTPSAADVQRLFSGLTVQRTSRGGLVIEAPHADADRGRRARPDEGVDAILARCEPPTSAVNPPLSSTQRGNTARGFGRRLWLICVGRSAEHLERPERGPRRWAHRA